MITVLLKNGCVIRSGWSDKHDPDALPCGDWLALSAPDGCQLQYIDIADVARDPRALRAALNSFLLAASRGT